MSSSSVSWGFDVGGCAPQSGAIHRLDPVGVFLLDELALELHRRCQLLVFGGELRLEEAKLLDLLDPRELAVDGLDLAPDEILHRLCPREARVVAERDVV